VIRTATEADLPRVLAMCERFFEAAGLPDVAVYDPETMERTLRQLMGGEMGALFVAERDGEVVGMTGGMLYPFYFNASHLTGQELFWWVDPEHRGVGRGLFDALEIWAKAMGAETFSMIALDRLNPERVAEIYRARGYRANEHSFIRRL
jgi:GNAT superfamily N-acetyltransferase